jgi:protein-disulfide isomerase
MGNPNAPVKMIEYADFQCPYCKQFNDQSEALIINTYINNGRVYYEFYPVVVAGAESERAAESVYCADDQGKFWEMHDVLYANQGLENSGAMKDARITAFAESIGLDMTKFNECFTSGKYKDQITQNGQDAAKNIHAASNFADVVANQKYPTSGYSTPSFLINNALIPGAQPFATFQKIIDAALAASGK